MALWGVEKCIISLVFKELYPKVRRRINNGASTFKSRGKIRVQSTIGAILPYVQMGDISSNRVKEEN
jgi:hypothetical protein